MAFQNPVANVVYLVVCDLINTWRRQSNNLTPHVPVNNLMAAVLANNSPRTHSYKSKHKITIACGL